MPASCFCRRLMCLTVLCVSVGSALTGCTSLFDRGNKTKDGDPRLKKLLATPEPPDLVREAAVPQGLNEIRVDGVAVVNQLPGTGGPALPSGFRDRLLEEMKRNEVPDPNDYLERDDTALVQVRGLIPPGARRGDPIDLQILTPPKTEATDLHSGWLLDTRLRHQQVMQNAVRSSDVMAIGTGPILTRADFDGTDDATLAVSGRVLSGGLVQIDRKLGLVLRPKFQHVKMATAIADAINRRFYFFDGTTRRGVAKAIEDDFIELDVHPRYRHHEERFLAVVRAVGVAPESTGTQAKLVQLAQELRNPPKAFDAAIQLEAMGEMAIPTLIEATELSNPELRFYAAEALAYLDRVEAINPLIQGIRDEPAFRAPALAALQGLADPTVANAVRKLLDETSLETRYGAMTTLRDRKDGRKALGGENLQGKFRLYEIPSKGPAAVVVSLNRKPEIVMMGNLESPEIQSFFIGPAGLVIRRVDPNDAVGKALNGLTSGPISGPTNSDSSDLFGNDAGGTRSSGGYSTNRLRISRFRPGQEDAFTEVDATWPGILRGITQVGGAYGDAVATLRMAKEQGVLVDQLAFDPLPQFKRTYYRDDVDANEDDANDNDEDLGDEDLGDEDLGDDQVKPL